MSHEHANPLAFENNKKDLKSALRYNEGKPKLGYIDLSLHEDMAKVLEFGAKKYSKNNWKKGLGVDNVLDSMLRHIAAIQKGEINDFESGLPHHAHIQCNAMFLANEFKLLEIQNEIENFKINKNDI